MSRVTNRYARALFELALEQKKLEIIEKDLGYVRELVEQNKDFKNLILNPLIETRKKVAVIDELFQNRLDTLCYRFLRLLTDKKRVNLLPEVIKRFTDLLLDHKGILKADLYSTYPIEMAEKKVIKDKLEQLTGKSIEFNDILDKSIVGGFVVRIKDTVIDLSVKGQLENLRQKMMQG